MSVKYSLEGSILYPDSDDFMSWLSPALLVTFGHMNTYSSPYQIVMTTFPDMDSAQQLAERLITQHLAACVNILPAMTSIYSWQDKLEHGQEHQLLIKTEQNRTNEVQNEIKQIHPYELPEIIVVPILDGHKPYLNWISESVHKND